MGEGEVWQNWCGKMGCLSKGGGIYFLKKVLFLKYDDHLRKKFLTLD